MSVREVPASPWSSPIIYSWYQEAESNRGGGGLGWDRVAFRLWGPVRRPRVELPRLQPHLVLIASHLDCGDSLLMVLAQASPPQLTLR